MMCSLSRVKSTDLAEWWNMNNQTNKMFFFDCRIYIIKIQTTVNTKTMIFQTVSQYGETTKLQRNLLPCCSSSMKMGGSSSPRSMVLSTKYAALHAKRLQPQNSSRTFNSSGMWHCCVIGRVLLDISNDGGAFVFRVKQSGAFERSSSTCPVTQHHIP